MNKNPEITAAPGTYLLLLSIDTPVSVRIGRLGIRRLHAGLYGYAGSARGPGGLAARLRRHASTTDERHWHIDYLMPYADIAGALVKQSCARLECEWAAWAAALAFADVSGLGASDCRCRSHMFFFSPMSNVHPLIKQAETDLQASYAPPSALGSR